MQVYFEIYGNKGHSEATKDAKDTKEARATQENQSGWMSGGITGGDAIGMMRSLARRATPSAAYGRL